MSFWPQNSLFFGLELEKIVLGDIWNDRGTDRYVGTEIWGKSGRFGTPQRTDPVKNHYLL